MRTGARRFGRTPGRVGGSAGRVGGSTLNGHWDSETGGSFTAISRTPYFRALSIWGKGNAWNGGGWFLSDRRFYLDEGYDEVTPLFQDPRFQRVRKPPFEEPMPGEDQVLYFPRLLRDGWELVARSGRRNGPTLFRKPLPAGWRLEKRFVISEEPSAPTYRDCHTLVSPCGRRVKGDDWSWADHDRVRDRLVFARDGKLLSAELGAGGEFSPVELKDFKDMVHQRDLPVPYESGAKRS